jgi:hypothetical protein
MSYPMSLGLYVLDTNGFRNPKPHEVVDLVKHSEPPSINYEPRHGGEFFVEEEYDEETLDTFWRVYSVSGEEPVSDPIEDDEEAYDLCETMNLEHDSQREDWEQDDFISNGFTWREIESDLSAWAKRIHFDVMADIRFDDDGQLQRLYVKADGTHQWITPQIVWPDVSGFPSFESEE